MTFKKEKKNIYTVKKQNSDSALDVKMNFVHFVYLSAYTIFAEQKSNRDEWNTGIPECSIQRHFFC